MSLPLPFLRRRSRGPGTLERASPPRARTAAGRGMLPAVLLAAADALAISAAFSLAYILRFHWQWALWPADPAPVGEYSKALAVLLYLWIPLFWAFGLHDLARLGSPLEAAARTVKAVSFGTLLVLGLGFLYRDFTFSRLVGAYGWAISIILVASIRAGLVLARARRRRRGEDLAPTALIGSRTLAQYILERTAREPELGYRVVGVLDEGTPPRGLPVPFLGSMGDLDEAITARGLEAVLIAQPALGHLDLLQVIETCERRGVALRMVPPTYDLLVNPRDLEEVGGIPLLRINEQEYRRWGDLAKRAIDLAASVAALVALAPLMALAAAAIRLEDGGPVLFLQRRVGKDGRPFTMFKLRTMVVGAEALLPRLVDLGGLSEPVFKLEEDPRVTRVGRLLRRASLDELPQLLNVLRGEMSLVGPRPEESSLVERYNVWERRRLKAVPGITGLQQVQCRGSTSLRERVGWDILYLRKRSLLLELWILLKTAWVVASGKGAR